MEVKSEWEGGCSSVDENVASSLILLLSDGDEGLLLFGLDDMVGLN